LNKFTIKNDVNSIEIIKVLFFKVKVFYEKNFKATYLGL